MRLDQEKEQSSNTLNLKKIPPPVNADLQELNKKLLLKSENNNLTLATPKVEASLIKPYKVKKYFTESKLFKLIKENWLGFFGSTALVVGMVFFSLTAKIMQKPEARVFLLLLFSFLILIFSHKKKGDSQWTIVCGCLKIVSGTVILFATLGAGFINGLCFIDSAIFAWIFLIFGVSINLMLAMTAHFQAVASFHVVLNIFALCFVPQFLIASLIIALVSLVGIISSYSSKWDLHYLLIVIAYAAQNTFYYFSHKSQLYLWMNYSTIVCSLIIASFVALVHYSKKYKSSKFELLPFLTHIANWTFLSWNLLLYSTHFKWVSYLLGVGAVIGFILAKLALKKQIKWLYYTDTVLSQCLAVSAIISLHLLQVNKLDICILLLLEIFAFAFAFNLKKEEKLVRFSYILLSFTYVFTFYVLSTYWKSLESYSCFSLSIRLLIIALTSWISYRIMHLYKMPIDSLDFISSGKKNQKHSFSITTLLGTVLFLYAIVVGYDIFLIQLTSLVIIAALIGVRKYFETDTWNLSVVSTILFAHLFCWIKLLGFANSSLSHTSLFSNSYLFALIAIDLVLIFKNFLEFKVWKKNFHLLLIYILGCHCFILVSISFGKTSKLLPAFCFLILSIIALEISKLKLTIAKYSIRIIKAIKSGFAQIGVIFLFLYCLDFVTLHVQKEAIFAKISLRWLSEMLAFSACFYWLVFSPSKIMLYKKTRKFCGYLTELFLAFITFCVFLEATELLRPVIWAIMAVIIIMGVLKYKWPKRVINYSWIYLIFSIANVSFVTKSLTMPKLFSFEKHYFCAYLATAVQVVYAIVMYKNSAIIEKQIKEKLVKLYDLLIFLPIFIGVFLFFFFNFEKTILTLLSVGLSCLYLSTGLITKTKRSISISMLALLICACRLILFDLKQTDLSVRALVFFGVGALTLGINILYKKYKHRIDFYENS